jgi:hypothetical protein
VPLRADEEPTVAAVEASCAPPLPVPVVVTEEEQTTAGATAPLAALETPTEAGPSNEDVVVVLDEDSVPPPSSESRDVVMAPASEPVQVAATASLLPAVEVSEPSAEAGVVGPPLTVEVVETSSAWGALTAEEVMELATCRYIDFPGVGVINLEAPQRPEKVFEVVTERMFTELMIMETIASVSKALQEYKRTGGFAPTVAAEAADAALEAPTAHVEPTVDASAPPSAIESREASLPQSAEAVEAPASVTKAGAAEVVVGEVGSLPPRPVAADARDVETRVPDDPAAAVQELVAPEMMTEPPPQRSRCRCGMWSRH